VNLYVYYKFLVDESPGASGLVRHIQGQLASEFPGLKYDLLKRPNKDDVGRETWMEVYSLNDDALPQFQLRLNQFALELNLPHPRLNELFVPIA